MINGFDRFGVYIATSSANVVAGNFIGTDPTGRLDRSIMRAGVYVDNTAPGNRIGGADRAERNLLSGNGNPGDASASPCGAGVHLGSQGNTVIGNDIGILIIGGMGNGVVPHDRLDQRDPRGCGRASWRGLSRTGP